jgi:PPOX class probable F420-dependent enzyme
MFDPANEFHRRILERLESDRVIWLTTVSPSGQPQPSPVWFWWNGEEFLVYSGATGRIANLRANPKVALNLDSEPENGLEQITIIEGVARVDPSTPPPGQMPGYLERYDRLITGIGLDRESFSEHYRFPIWIRPLKVRGW